MVSTSTLVNTTIDFVDTREEDEQFGKMERKGHKSMVPLDAATTTGNGVRSRDAASLSHSRVCPVDEKVAKRDWII